MPRLPVVSGRELVKALEKAGFVVDRQKGSHIVMRQTASPHRRVTIPEHKEVAKGTLRSILRHSGITKEELVDLLG